MPGRRPKAGKARDPRPGDEFAAYVAEMFAPLGVVRVARLFSGHGFKCDGVHFAMIIRGVLYLRADAGLAHELSTLGARPFAYRTKQRTVTVGSYYAVPEDRLDEMETMLGWARRALRAARENAERISAKRAKPGPDSTRKVPRRAAPAG
jgi:DNA transformation protein